MEDFYSLVDSVYVVSLPDAFERRLSIKKRLESVGIDKFSFINGERVGDNIPENRFLCLNYKVDDFSEKNNYRKRAFGAFLGHFKAISECANPKNRVSLVLEDDVVLVDDFSEKIIELVSYLDLEKRDWMAVNLVRREYSAGENVLKTKEDVVYRGTTWGQQGYLYKNSESLRTFLEVLAASCNEEIDCFFCRCSNFLPLYGIIKQLVFQDNEIKSSICLDEKYINS